MYRHHLLNKKYTKTHIKVCVFVSLYIIFLQVTKIYSPLLLIGIKGPTTGITRAWRYLLQGQIHLAFQMHRLFIVAPFLAYYLYKYMLLREKRDFVVALSLSLLFFIYWLTQILI